MATITVDTVQAPSGTGGPDLGFDDVSGTKVALTKLVFGGDGIVVASWSHNAGVVDDGTPRVTLGDNDPAVAALEAIASYLDTEIGAILVGVELLADWDESGRAKVNLIPGQAGISAGTGTVAANTPRVTLASNDPVTVALQAMDDWDESDRCAVNIISGVAGITGGAGNVLEGTPRVTLANDDPAVSELILNRVSLQILDDWDETDRCKVNPIVGSAGLQGSSGVVSANTLRVTVATNDSIVSDLGAIKNGTSGPNVNSALTTHDASVPSFVGMIGLQGRDTEPTAVGDAEACRALATLLGKQIVVPYSIPSSTWSYAAASGGITNTTGVTAKTAAGVSFRNYVTRAQIINGHATVSTDIQIRDGASGTVLWRGFAQSGGGGVTAVFDPPLRGSSNTLIEIACGTTGSATYFNLQGYVARE